MEGFIADYVIEYHLYYGYDEPTVVQFDSLEKLEKFRATLVSGQKKSIDVVQCVMYDDEEVELDSIHCYQRTRTSIDHLFKKE